MDEQWTIIFKRQADKTFRHLPNDVKKRIDQAISVLSKNPRPPNSRKLVGYDDLYRLRVGDWRIIYAIQNEELIILVIKIAPRGEVYQDI